MGMPGVCLFKSFINYHLNPLFYWLKNIYSKWSTTKNPNLSPIKKQQSQLESQTSIKSADDKEKQTPIPNPKEKSNTSTPASDSTKQQLRNYVIKPFMLVFKKLDTDFLKDLNTYFSIGSNKGNAVNEIKHFFSREENLSDAAKHAHSILGDFTFNCPHPRVPSLVVDTFLGLMI